MPHRLLFSAVCLFFSALAVTNLLALDGTVVAKLDFDKEEIGKPPVTGNVKVTSSPTETVLVQADPRDQTSKEIVLTGKDDGKRREEYHL